MSISYKLFDGPEAIVYRQQKIGELVVLERGKKIKGKRDYIVKFRLITKDEHYIDIELALSALKVTDITRRKSGSEVIICFNARFAKTASILREIEKLSEQISRQIEANNKRARGVVVYSEVW